MLHLANLCSSEVLDGVAPWDFCDLSAVPERAFSDKSIRDRWINNPELQYHVYTLYEGTQKNLRMRSARTNEEENPPAVAKGFAVDYDAKITLAELLSFFERFGVCLPAWAERTLSGNLRLIWLFERELTLPSRRFLKLLLDRIQELVPVDRIAGLDKPALLAPERYFTNGARWVKLSNYVIPFDELKGWVIKASEKFDWNSRDLGRAISIKAIEEECRRKFPRFAEWPGSFEIGAQGPSFWIDGSTSSKSAFVRETGIHTFSAHAPKAFYSWSEIVGSEFVDNSERTAMGKAVEGIFYDSQKFIYKDAAGKYVFENRQNLELMLRVKRGVSDKRPKNGHSDLEIAISHILDCQRVDGAASCAFYPHGLFEFQGRKILNTHQIEALKPSGDAAVWGEGGGFPFTSKFFDSFFSPNFPQLDIFLAWLQLFYKSCLHRQPRSGHGVFICGPVGAGKNFLSNGIVAGLVGGHAPANEYLIGSDDFNSELFDSACWTIDDGTVMNSSSVHRLFSESVKKTVANRTHRVNEKFRKAVVTPWQGRIIVTCNDDAISIRIIPNLDLSIKEKLLILRAGPRAVQFLEQPEMEKLLAKELPHFARWLLDWTPPAHCFLGADVRFGVTSYCEESLARSANRSSDVSVFSELLTQWLRGYFQNEGGNSLECWEGSATQLRIAMSSDPVFAEMLRGYRPEAMPQMLALLQQKGMFKIMITDGDTERLFRIEREERFLRNLAPSVSIPQAENSKFEKK